LIGAFANSVFEIVHEIAPFAPGFPKGA